MSMRSLQSNKWNILNNVMSNKSVTDDFIELTNAIQDTSCWCKARYMDGSKQKVAKFYLNKIRNLLSIEVHEIKTNGMFGGTESLELESCTLILAKDGN